MPPGMGSPSLSANAMVPSSLTVHLHSYQYAPGAPPDIARTASRSLRAGRLAAPGRDVDEALGRRITTLFTPLLTLQAPRIAEMRGEALEVIERRFI